MVALMYLSQNVVFMTDQRKGGLTPWQRVNNMTSVSRAYITTWSGWRPSAGLFGGNQMRKFWNRFFRDEQGATAIEYGLIAALIAVPIISFLPGIGTKLQTVFQTIDTALTPAGTSGTGTGTGTGTGSGG